MKIILKQDVDNLGDAGEVVDVATGYANNYLIPQNLAMRATTGVVKDAEAIRRSRLKREAGNIAAAEEVKAMLQGRTLSITARAGVDGTLYGSVGKRDIAALIGEKTGVKVDHKKLPLDRPLKTTGQHAVQVSLHREVTAEVIIDVVGEVDEAELAAAQAAAEAAEAEAEAEAAEGATEEAGEDAATAEDTDGDDA